MNAAWPQFVFTASCLLLAGCATTQVTVDALAKPKAEESISYQLSELKPSTTVDSPHREEAVGYVKAALSGKGLYEAPQGAPVDLVIDVDYGIDPPQVRRDVYPPMESLADSVFSPNSRIKSALGEDVVTTIVYKKYIKLTAREKTPRGEGRPPADVWSITVTSEGERKDLDKVLPVLVAASIAYIGKDSHGEIVIEMKDNDPAVAFVKKGM